LHKIGDDEIVDEIVWDALLLTDEVLVLMIVIDDDNVAALV
jgi:hypothetical protein